MSKKQTAVQWLVEQLLKKSNIQHINGFDDLVDQAKEIEKEQIIQIAKDNCEELGDDEAEEYYNDQFN